MTEPSDSSEDRRAAVLRPRWFLIIVGLSVLATVPWIFIGGRGVRVAGVPLWLWWSLGATAVLSFVTAWGVARRWRNDRLE